MKKPIEKMTYPELLESEMGIIQDNGRTQPQKNSNTKTNFLLI